MHGLKGGSWKRSVGHGHRSWAPGGNPGDERRAYRHHTSPRQLPTRLRYGVSARTFCYLDLVAWRRVTRWLRQRHKGINWKTLYRRFLTARPGNRPVEGNVVLFMCQKVEVTRYRWRAGNIPSPWPSG